MSLGHRSSRGFEKLGHPTEEVARARAAQRNQQRPHEHRVAYRCSECGLWHVGRTDQPSRHQKDFERIVAFVAQYRAEHNTGPTFYEVWLALGKEPVKRNRRQDPELQEFAHYLITFSANGWLRRSKKRGSLDVGPRSKKLLADKVA